MKSSNLKLSTDVATSEDLSKIDEKINELGSLLKGKQYNVDYKNYVEIASVLKDIILSLNGKVKSYDIYDLFTSTKAILGKYDGEIAENAQKILEEELSILDRTFNEQNQYSVEIDDGVEYIGKELDYAVKPISSISFSDESTCKAIFPTAFSFDVALKDKIVFPKSLEFIGAQAFLNCSNIKEVEIQKFPLFIGENAFGGCMSLSNVIVDAYLSDVQKWQTSLNLAFEPDTTISCIDGEFQTTNNSSLMMFSTVKPGYDPEKIDPEMKEAADDPYCTTQDSSMSSDSQIFASYMESIEKSIAEQNKGELALIDYKFMATMFGVDYNQMMNIFNATKQITKNVIAGKTTCTTVVDDVTKCQQFLLANLIHQIQQDDDSKAKFNALKCMLLAVTSGVVAGGIKAKSKLDAISLARKYIPKIEDAEECIMDKCGYEDDAMTNIFSIICLGLHIYDKYF